MKIRLLDGLHLDVDGNLINAEGDQVHLRQGDMDGACGPYCVAMALLVTSKTTRYELEPPCKIDYRTRTGKLLKAIHSFDPLVLRGTSASDICGILEAHNQASGLIHEGSSLQLVSKVKQAIDNGHPVILDVQSKRAEGLNHWTLAIGYSDDYIHLLDPGYELRESNFWNATLTTKPSSNRFGYRYMNPWVCHDVEMSTMIEIEPIA